MDLPEGAASMSVGLDLAQVLAISALVLITAALLYVYVRKPDRLDHEALQRLARKRGWRIERRLAAAGKGFQIEVAPTEVGTWSCVVTRYQNLGSGGFVLKTEFADTATRLRAGMVVIGPGIPAKEAEMAASLLGEFDGKLGQMLLSTMLGDEAAEVRDLRLARETGLPGATAFATQDAPVGSVGAVYAPLLAAWLRAHRHEKEFPILLMGPDRLRIRLRTDASDADQLEAFLDHALATSRQLVSRANDP